MQQHRVIRLVLVLLLATACTKADEPQPSAATSPSPTTAGRPSVGNLAIEEPHVERCRFQLGAPTVLGRT